MFYKFFLSYIKNEWIPWFNQLSKKPRRNIKDYYENNKERLREQAKEKYRNLSEEEKKKKKNMEKMDITICLKKKK